MTTQKKKNTYSSSSPAVAQAAQILLALGRHPGDGMNLTDICKQVGIHKSKGFSILNALTQYDFISKDSQTKSYSLGPAFYYLPQAVHYHQNNPYEALWGDVLNPFVPPLHYEEGLSELLATRKTFWYITCNTGASLPLFRALGDVQGWDRWEPSGPRVVAFETYSPIMFKAQKYVLRE